jgi:hypothetical protein
MENILYQEVQIKTLKYGEFNKAKNYTHFMDKKILKLIVFHTVLIANILLPEVNKIKL